MNFRITTLFFGLLLTTLFVFGLMIAHKKTAVDPTAIVPYADQVVTTAKADLSAVDALADAAPLYPGTASSLVPVVLFLAGGVHGDFRGGQLEDQPAAAGIHRFHAEDVAEEGAVLVGILAVDDGMRPGDHCSRLSRDINPPRAC